MAFMDDFLCMEFLFAVISMHHTVDQLVAKSDTCPFVRDPFSRGDVAREGLAFNEQYLHVDSRSPRTFTLVALNHLP